MSPPPRTDGRREIVENIRQDCPDIDDAHAQRIVTVVVEHMKQSVRKVGAEMTQRTAREVATATGLEPFGER